MSTTEPKTHYNILMLAPTMFFADYGCHVRILEEAIVLRNMGHRVTILAYPNGRDIAGLDVRRGWGVPFNYRIEVGSSRHKIYLDGMLALKSLGHVLADRPDIIHAHLHEGGLLGWFLSKLTGAPLIFDFQGSLTGEMIDHNFLKPTSPFFRPLRWLERRIDHMAHAVLTSSRHAARLLRDTYGVPEGRIHPTPDCVNPEAFNPARFSHASRTALKRALGIPPGRQLLVYVGLLTEYQGVGHLLRALARLRAHRQDVHLLLMGFGGLQHYVSLARELGLSDAVTFTGKMPYERLPAHLALGDIAVAPKLSATEGNGKVLNYMSMALPTVAFPTPVSREYLGRHGLYAAARTPAALADALDRALSLSPAARADLGRALRDRILANYTWANIGQQIEAVYRAVLDGHPHPAQAVKQAATYSKSPT